MNGGRRTALAALMLAVFTAVAPAGGEPGPERWTASLEALRPEDPLAYFELAERIADAAAGEAGSVEERELARHLFALAGALDPAGLGRSACLALAVHDPDEAQRSRWAAMAALLDERGASAAEDEALAGSSAMDGLFEAFSHYRRGEGNRAIGVLRRPGVTELLETYGSLLPGGAERFLDNCRLYRGGQRPPLRSRTVTTMLKLEEALRAGRQRSWAGELLLTGGRPLLDVDPDRLDEALGVDAERAYFRDGAWVDE